MTDDLSDLLPEDIERIARQTPAIPNVYLQLRQLIQAINAPTLPDIRSARLAAAVSAAEASDFGAGERSSIAGGPPGTESGGLIGSGISGLDAFGNIALAGGGIGPAWRRFFTNGILNGDFGQAPYTPANDFDSIENPLPYWTPRQVPSGGRATAKWLATSLSASGGSVAFSMVNPQNGDEAFIEQVIPVNGSAGKSFSTVVFATFRIASALLGANPEPSFFLEVQFLQADGLTTTGTATRVERLAVTSGASFYGDLDAAANGGIMPADAYFLYIAVGVTATAPLTNSRSNMQLTEVRINVGQTRVYLVDPAGTKAPVYLEMQAGGAVQLIGAPLQRADAPIDKPATADLTPLGTAGADVPGCTVTYTPTATEWAIVDGVFDFEVTAAGATVCVGELLVDGVAQARQAIYKADAAALGRATVSQRWIVSLTAAAHTLKLQGRKTVAVGTAHARSPHTAMTVLREGR